MADAMGAVAIDRTGDRELLGQGGVGNSGEDHGNHADEVDQGRHAAGILEDAAIDAERCNGHHEDEAVDQHVRDGQRSLELLLVAHLLKGFFRSLDV